MPHPSLPPAIETVGSALRLCKVRRAGQAHRPGRADARETKAIGHVAVPTVTEMSRTRTAAGGKLDELRTLASHLTAGSLLQAATLQLIAEQEDSPHWHAPARVAELSRQA